MNPGHEVGPAAAQAVAAPSTDRGARLRALHDVALRLAAPAPDSESPGEAMLALLGEVLKSSIGALGGHDGLLLLAEDPAWRDLLPGSVPADGHILLRSGNVRERREVRPSGPTRRVLTTGDTLRIADVHASSEYGPFPELAARGVLSLTIIPLQGAGRVVGVLSVGFAHTGTLSADDEEMLALFAAHAAAAIERARLEAARREADSGRREALARLALQSRELAGHESEAATLRELDRLKDEFIGAISHELRTPLTLIHGYAELLNEQVDTLRSDEIAAMAREIYSSSRRLTYLVEDLLDFGRIQRGETKVQRIEFDLGEVIRAVVDDFRLRPGGDRLTLSLAPRDGAILAQGDPERTGLIASNLITNALQYAPTGPIGVRAGRSGLTARVEIEDRGPGIAPEEQPRVWEKFYRGVELAGMNVVPGGGIGLAVVRALVEAQGGRAGLESRPGEGARFWFEIPAVA